MSTAGMPGTARNDYYGNIKAASGFVMLAGLWLLMAPFVLGHGDRPAAMWNEIVVGALVLVLGGVRVANPARFAGLSWVNVIAGLWLVAAPFVCGYSDVAPARWNDMIVGIVIAALAASSASMTSSLRRYHGFGEGPTTPPPGPTL
jgi:hypothetical protein